MNKEHSSFSQQDMLHDLKHFLPAQAPLKDFVHHNTLHAFQDKKFHDALHQASVIFGYKTYLSLEEYRDLFRKEKIDKAILDKVIIDKKGSSLALLWCNKVYHAKFEDTRIPRIGALRSNWKSEYRIDLDSMVHPSLFRILCSYLDQGISIWNFPGEQKGFLASMRELEKNSFVSFFKSKRAKRLLMDEKTTLETLLKILVGDESLYSQYIFDQQFAHPGWSGLVSVVEDIPQTLLDRKEISLKELIIFESLMEIDVLDSQFGEIWAPISEKTAFRPETLFAPVEKTDLDEVIEIWQEAFELTYYDQVLAGVQAQHAPKTEGAKTFQAMFCIDDRECSIRRYVESTDPHSETFGTPGHFNLDFYFQPENGKFHTKVCPAPVSPQYLIKEMENSAKGKNDVHFHKQTHGLFVGWILTHTLGFWSAFRLFLSIFRPASSPSSVSSFSHMGKDSLLTIQNKSLDDRQDNLQIGYTIEEMANRVEALLKSIGLVDNFAQIVYAVGHGSSSVNNTHYAGYDCGACSGRPGSVNARAISSMANNPEVRAILRERGIHIPVETQFVGALHDTSRDEIAFYDLKILSPLNAEAHKANAFVFTQALDLNAKERSRRFMLINTKKSAASIHRKVRTRTVSLFEPRPELNHATNTLCLIGRREFSKGIVLDRRSFLNSFDYRVDPEGKYLLNILNAAAPVCGGINLEYYFSRVDNQKLGAGTKLPHNVMGLIGVANGIDGDLRPGLPSQMVEVHDPLRLMMIVEHFPEVVLETIQKNPATYEWFNNEWVKLVVFHPETKALFIFRDGAFKPYEVVHKQLETLSDITPVIESTHDNLPVYLISQH